MGYGYRNKTELKAHFALKGLPWSLCGAWAYNLRLVYRHRDVTCKNCLRGLEKRKR